MNLQPTIGIISPGDMGHAIGAVLRQHSLRILTNLQDRSARTAALAAQAGMIDVAMIKPWCVKPNPWNGWLYPLPAPHNCHTCALLKATSAEEAVIMPVNRPIWPELDALSYTLVTNCLLMYR